MLYLLLCCIIFLLFSYDVIYTAGLEEIVSKFKSFPDTRVVFSAEPYCWPDASRASLYPKVDGQNPYLNSGGFIGNI